jgi:hypothetical protein
MADESDPVRSQVRTELLNAVLPWIMEKAFETTEIAEGIERAGIDPNALFDRVSTDQRLLLTNSPEFAAVYQFARAGDGRIDQKAFAREIGRAD